MNILFTRFPFTSANGGAENQTMSLMDGLMHRGHTVNFLGSCPVLLERCDRLAVGSWQLAVGNPPVTKWDAISFTWRKIAMKRKLQKALEQMGSVDAICMLSLSEKILLTPIALAKGIKVVWIEHDTVADWLAKNPSLHLLLKMSANVTTICVSDLSADIFCDLGYKNVKAIPNGVKHPPEDFVKHDFDETLRVGCIARLSEEKGVDVLVEAMRSVENATLLINGKGNMHIPSSATVTLKANVSDIDDVYRQIDVLVLPSRKEDPFGLVIAEAMLRSIPTICTDACGIAGYLDEGLNALIVPADDNVALAKALNRMQDADTREHIGSAGRKAALEMFTIEIMVNNYESVLSV